VIVGHVDTAFCEDKITSPPPPPEPAPVLFAAAFPPAVPLALIVPVFVPSVPVI
jgi:hypothetical protein